MPGGLDEFAIELHLSMFGWFKRTRTLEEALLVGKSIRVHSIIFRIRKLNPLDYFAGTQALRQHFELYKTKGEKEQLAAMNAHHDKIKDHMRDVFMAAVLSPNLSRKPEARLENEHRAIFVDHLFTDWDLANELYERIVEYTYGKKKFRALKSQGIGS